MAKLVGEMEVRVQLTGPPAERHTEREGESAGREAVNPATHTHTERERERETERDREREREREREKDRRPLNCSSLLLRCQTLRSRAH